MSLFVTVQAGWFKHECVLHGLLDLELLTLFPVQTE